MTMLFEVMMAGSTASTGLAFAINAGGINNTPSLFTTVDKYTYATDARTAATALTTALSEAAGASTITSLYLLGGRIGTSTNTAKVQIYSYAGNSWGTGTDLTVVKRSGAGVGSSSIGIHMGGFTTAKVTSCSKYTYATNATSNGTVLSVASSFQTGFSSLTAGYAAGNNNLPTTVVEKYTFSSDTRISGGSLPANRGQASTGNGNQSVGILGGGVTGTGGTTTDAITLYTYSSETAANATTKLGAADFGQAGSTSKDGLCMFFGTEISPFNTVRKYNISTNASGTGTTLGSARWFSTSGASTPNVFA